MSTRFLAGALAGLALLTPFAPAASPPDDGLLPPPYLLGEQPQKDHVTTLMKAFHSLYKEGRYGEAEAIARRAHELAPDHPAINAALQVVQRQQADCAARQKEMNIERRLGASMTVNFASAPLKRVIDDLRDSNGINIVFDLPALQEAGVSLETPVTLKLDQVPLKAVLQGILQQVKLTFTIRDEVVLITTQEHAHGKLMNITYSVGDLVIPVTVPGACGKKAKPPGTTEEQLIKLITSSVAPRTWSEMGGKGTVDYFPLTMALVVNQTPDVQEQISDLLSALRRQQETEVSVEIRFLTISDECLGTLGLNDEEVGKASAAILDDSQVAVLLEKVQSDPKARVMQMPRLTCLNRQKAAVEVNDRQAFVTGVDVVPAGERKGFRPRVQTVSTGLGVSVLPYVAPDNKSVMLQLAVHLARVDAARTAAAPSVSTAQPPRSSTLSLERTVRVPDGATALLSGWSVQRESHNEVAPPIIGALPQVGQLFRALKATHQKEHLLLLVTPRIIVPPPEVEEKRTAQVYPQPQGSTEASEPKEKEPAVLFVGSRSFTLAYDVANEGPSRVAGVVVWYTRDGKTWHSYPEQVKPTRTLPITVVSDGRYGFTLVAKSGAGLSVAPPKPGDVPQVWVEVDTQQPTAELYAPQPDSEHPGTLVLSWKANDQNLAGNPVTLEWASSADGPWSTIGGNLPNTGRHTWQVPDNLPERIHLRLTVRDSAGNTTVAQTHDGVVVDLKVPTTHGVKVKAN
jgi:type II secretory pathway component GspD/PulD (secretin)